MYPGANPTTILWSRVVALIITGIFVSCGQSPSFVEQSTERQAAPGPQTGDAIVTGSGDDVLPPETAVTDSQDNSETDSGGDADSADPVDIGSDEDEGRFTSEVKTNDGQTVAIDTFSLAESFPITESLENTRNPLKTYTHIQDLGAPRSATRTILSRSFQTKTFQKTAPLRSEQPHTIDHTNKPLDLFVTVDDSESFTQASIERTRSAVHKLVEDVFTTDWKLFIGGLEGVSGSYDKTQINKGTQTLAQAKSAIDTALNSIFAEGSNGDERVIRSLNRLAYDYRNSDRDNAVHAYLVISDAPNCKDRNNSESSACNRTAGQNDHHTFLQSANTNVAAHIRTNMQLVGAYFRQTSNLAVCGNADDVEAPVGETLKLASQYAEMSFASERSLDPTIATTATPSFVGDLCSVNESLAWLTTFTNAIKSTTARRFALTQAPDTFVAPDTSYNLVLHKPVGTVLAASNVTVKDTYVIVLNPALTGTVTAVYHKHNNFRKTNYDNLLSPIPENGTVQISWATGGPFDCVYAASFSGQPADVKCRHTSDDLYLRDTDFLPGLAPGNAPVTITVNYYNHVEPVTVLEVTSSEVIFSDTVAFVTKPAGVNPASATKTTTPDGKTVRFTFPAALPPGDYAISYVDYGQTRKNFVVPSQAAAGPDSYLCYLPGPGVTAALNSSEQVVVSPPEAEYPCTLTAGSGQVQYENRVPEDDQGERSIAIAYKGFVSPIGVFALEYPPFNDEVTVTVASAADPDDKIVLDPGTYLVSDNQVILTDPLQPGESITLDYLFLPPLKDCYVLSGKVLKDHKYHVWYGPPGGETRLDTALYTIEKKDKGQTICLDATVPDYGNRLVVGYIVHENPRPDIK